MKRAFVFPGQGSQSVGMGRALADAMPEARVVFEEVDDALEQNLSRFMFEGPEDELTLTENAQPALMAFSVAIVRTLENAGMDLATSAAFVAGHSLGEYSALAAAKALTLADTARLLKARGRAMQDAVPVGAGAMAALLGVDAEQAAEIAAAAARDLGLLETTSVLEAGDICAVANDNGGGQVVLSGDAAAVDRAIEIAKERGAKRAIPLAVSAPFHSALMAPAAEVMAEALAEVALGRPVVPLIANVSAEPVRDPAVIRGMLVKQVTSMVRWRETVVYLRSQEVELLAELGAGKVLTGLTRRIDRELQAVSVQMPDEIEAFYATL